MTMLCCRSEKGVPSDEVPMFHYLASGEVRYSGFVIEDCVAQATLLHIPELVVFALRSVGAYQAWLAAMELSSISGHADAVAGDRKKRSAGEGLYSVRKDFRCMTLSWRTGWVAEETSLGVLWDSHT